MHRKRRKKSSRRVKSKKVKLPLVVDPKTRKESVAVTVALIATLGVIAYVAYQIIVNGHCWSLS